MADKETVLDIMLEYLSYYPKSDVSDARLVKYAEMLEKFQEVDIRKAMDNLMTKCKFFPSLAEIYEHLTPDGQVREVWEPPQEELAIMQALYDEADREFDEKVARLRELGKAKGE